MAKLDDDGNRVVRRMRWNSETQSGELIDDEGSGTMNLLGFFKERTWEIETNKQKFCDYWSSHVLKEGKCVLCDAMYINESNIIESSKSI